MQPFVKHTGIAAPLFRANIDTDQIVPKKFLLLTERTGFDKALFADWRFCPNGVENPDFVLNDSRYSAASVLLTGKNFGCGSSREHAAWALVQYGFRTVIAPSFADIFYSNAIKNGLLPIVIPENDIIRLVKNALEEKDYSITVDLGDRRVSDSFGFEQHFELDDFHRECLINGLDDISLTLRHERSITQYELKRRRA